MSIFNFRRGRSAGDVASGRRSAVKVAPESVELIRKRARQRLIGSAVLVLMGVIGFPLLFESQPRPVPVDIPIEIPARAGIKPGAPIEPVVRGEPAPVSPPEAAAPAPLAAQPAPESAAQAAVQPQASLQDKEEIVETPPKDLRASSAPEPQAESRPQPRAASDDGQRARALLEGAPARPAAADGRIVVQVGAFADVAKAREVRARLEKAGLKTYTQVAETKDGSRIRVRVGPFSSKADAEKAAAKIKALNLPAAILLL